MRFQNDQDFPEKLYLKGLVNFNPIIILFNVHLNKNDVYLSCFCTYGLYTHFRGVMPRIEFLRKKSFKLNIFVFNIICGHYGPVMERLCCMSEPSDLKYNTF